MSIYGRYARTLESRQHHRQTLQLSLPATTPTTFSFSHSISLVMSHYPEVSIALFGVQLSIHFGHLAQRGSTRALQRWLLTLSTDEPSRPPELCLGSLLYSTRLSYRPCLDRLPAGSRVPTELSVHGPRSFQRALPPITLAKPPRITLRYDFLSSSRHLSTTATTATLSTAPAAAVPYFHPRPIFQC